MVKLMVVDDEADIVDGMLTLVDWQSIGVEVCDTAADGLEAQEKILLHRPDIAIIDINIGKMNGLELLEWAYSEGLPMKFIVLSGYSSFDYAQTAMRHGVLEYLLKPCWPEQILQAVQKCIDQIQTEREKQRQLEEYRESVDKYHRLLKEKWMVRVLERGLSALEGEEERIAFYQLRIPGDGLNLVVLRVNREPLSAADGDCAEVELTRLAALDLVRDMFEQTCGAYEILSTDENIVVVFSQRISEAELEASLRDLLRDVRALTGGAMSAVVGRGGLALSQLWREYGRCQSLLDCDAFFDRQSVTFVDRATTSDVHRLQAYPENLEAEILNCYQTGTLATLRDGFDRFFADICDSDPPPTKEYLTRVSFLLVSRVCWSCMKAETLSNDVELTQTEAFGDILKAPNMETLHHAVWSFLEIVYNAQDQSKSANRIVRDTMRFISDHYMKNIRLEDIVKEIYVSPCYLSNLFKKETGVNLIDYLNIYRVNIAKQRLAESNLRVYEIATQVGFQDERYFTRVFKKHTGMSPKQYRDTK